MIALHVPHVARVKVNFPAVVFNSQLHAVQALVVPLLLTNIHCLEDESEFIHHAIVKAAVGLSVSGKFILLVLPLKLAAFPIFQDTYDTEVSVPL